MTRKRARRRNYSTIVGIRDWATARIEAGDMDFDDYVYRTQEAAQTLINIWFSDLDTKQPTSV